MHKYKTVKRKKKKTRKTKQKLMFIIIENKILGKKLKNKIYNKNLFNVFFF